MPIVITVMLLAWSVAAPALGQGAGTLRKVVDVAPIYPEAAREQGVAGTVVVRLVIGTDGRVTDARVTRSVPMLDEAALTAVRQWVYDASTLRRPRTITVRVAFPADGQAAPAGARPPTNGRRAERGVAAPRTVARRDSLPSAGGSSGRSVALPCTTGSAAPAPAPAAPTGALTPEQKAQAEIRQLSARIGSGSLTDEQCLEAVRRRGYLYAVTGAGGLARRDLDALIANDPDDREAHFSRGLSYFTNPILALPSFDRAIALRPDAESHSVRGWARLVQQQYRDAVADFETVLQEAPRDAEALRGRAWGRLLLGEHAAAIADLNALIDLGPNPEAVAMRGAARYLAGQPTEALPDLRASARFAPRVTTPRTYEGLRIDDWRRHGVLERVLEERARRTKDVVGWLAAAAIAYRANDEVMSGAARGVAGPYAAFRMALSTDPGSIDALMMRASTHAAPFFGFSPKEAAADLTEVIRLQPRNAEAYALRAMVYASDKASLGLAIADCERALQIVPRQPVVEIMLRRLQEEDVAWRAEQRRAAAARARRDEEVRKTAEQMAAAFLTYVATRVAAGPPPLPTPEDRIHEAIQTYIDNMQSIPRR
ncbi:MAG: TonB family protein [Vicinamibacterales bacterium]